MKRLNLNMMIFVILFTLSTSSISTAETNSFCNTASISIPSRGSASAYPSKIDVSDLKGSTTKVISTLKGIWHTSPRDLNVLLVAPNGRRLILMSGAGERYGIEDVTITFDDAGDSGLPQPITSGIYEPSNYSSAVYFPSPAPIPSEATTLATFNDTNPTGTWQLYVYDGWAGNPGIIEDGWCITITTPDTVIDSDGDGVYDDEDDCPGTPQDAYIDEYGCSGEQLVDEACSCDFAWKNHGEYVRCVAHEAEYQLADGFITLEEKDAIVAEGAAGDCGKKK